MVEPRVMQGMQVFRVEQGLLELGLKVTLKTLAYPRVWQEATREGIRTEGKDLRVTEVGHSGRLWDTVGDCCRLI